MPRRIVLGVVVLALLVPSAAWAHPPGQSCSALDPAPCFCDTGATGGGCTLRPHPHPPADDDDPPPDEERPDEGGGDDEGATTGQPISTTPAQVCEKIRQEGTTDHRFDGSIWAIGVYRCMPSGDIDRRNICILACPVGYVEPPDPPAPVVAVPAGPVAPPPLTPEQLLYQAYADLPPTAPPMQVEPATPVVGVSTFLHVPDLEVRSTTVSDGPISVTVTATPVEVLWQFGDHEWSCPTGGVPYTEARLEQSMDAGALVSEPDLCTFLFEVTSAKAQDGPYPSRVRTVWDYSWAINGVDQGIFNGGFPSPVTNFDLTVREIQAVLTNE